MKPGDVVKGPEYEIIIIRRQTVVRWSNDWREAADMSGERYAYVEASLPKEEDTEVYKQVVDAIDLSRVIAAVNGLPEATP